MRKEWLILCLLLPLLFGCERRETETPVVVNEPPAAVTVPPAPTVENLAETNLPDLAAQPLYFRLVRIVLPAGQLAQYAAGDSMLYQLAGTIDIATGESTRKIGAGQGMYVAAGSLTSYLASAGDQAVYLQFMLAPKEDLGRSLQAGENLQVEDVFVSAEPLPALNGSYRFALTRLQYPPGATTPPAAERTAAGLYYVTKGSGEFSGGETPETVQTGAAVLAPVEMGGAWNNPGQEPLEVVFTSLVPSGEAPAAGTEK